MSSAAGAAGGETGAGVAAEAARQAGIRRNLEGDEMSIWVVNQDKDKVILAIGFRTRRSRLITMRVAEKDVRKVEVPLQ